MSHDCKHERLSDKQFDEYRRKMIDKVADLLVSCQYSFIKANKCQTDFNSLILTFALDHIISTIRHVCKDAEEDAHGVLLRVIERISEGTGVKFVNTEIDNAMEQRRSSTIQ